MTTEIESASVGTKELSEERLVLEANRIFHDLEGEHYEQKHDEIFVSESARWQRVAGTWLAGSVKPRKILDLGTGTGFVPSVIAPFLSVEDEITCTDLSKTMLEVARRRLQDEKYLCRFAFQSVNGIDYPLPSKSFDVITGNSVIHHIPDLPRLFGELDRLLRPGGMICLGHEPNARHYRTPALTRRAAWLGKVCDPVGGAIALGKTLRLDRLARALGVHQRMRGAALEARGGGLAEQVASSEKLVDEVRNAFVEEGILSEAPSRAQIVEWVDFHSPTAGAEVDPERGLQIEQIRTEWLPDYELLQFETYDHFYSGGHAVKRTRFTDRIDRQLAARYPEAGATLFAVLGKPAEPA